MSTEATSPSVAVVTGGSDGIGYAAAYALGKEGWEVVIASRRPQAGRRAEQELRGRGIAATWTETDVAEPDDIERLADVASARGRLGVWVNNAGLAQIKPSMDVTPDDWDAVYAVNVRGAFVGACAAARAMREHGGGGVVVNIGSVAGHVGMPARAAYCASKHAVEGLTKVLAIDWGEHGVRVVGVDPGYIMTDMVRRGQKSAGFELEHITRRIPLRRLGEAAEIGDVVAMICRPEASYMTGSTIRVDGGFVAHGGFEDLT